MTLGAATSQLPEDGTQSIISIPVAGLFLMLSQVTLSGISATYLEWLVKKDFQESLNLQNLKMYLFGILFNGIAFFFFQTESKSLFQGHSWISFLIIFIMASQGLVTGWIMKYADSIVKTYATAVAMFITAAFSHMFFGSDLTTTYFFGAANCSIALFLYAKPKKRKTLPN